MVPILAIALVFCGGILLALGLAVATGWQDQRVVGFVCIGCAVLLTVAPLLGKVTP